MQFDYITARKMQVQTRMKRRTLQWRICLMRHALGPLNEQLSSREQCSVPQGGLSLAGSMLAVGSGPRGSDSTVIAPSSVLGHGLPFPCVWCEMLTLHPCPQTWTSHSFCSLPWLTDSAGGDTDVSSYIQAFVAQVWACVGGLTQWLGSGPPQSFFAARHSFELFCVV